MSRSWSTGPSAGEGLLRRSGPTETRRLHSSIPLAVCLAALGCAPFRPHSSRTEPAAAPAAPGAGNPAPFRAYEPQPGTLPERWISGGPDCGTEPAIQVHAYDRDLFILRQSLCTNFEAPFIYLIFGREKVLMVDTGAGGIPIQETVSGVIQSWLASSGVSSIARAWSAMC